jgi:hypothetical protein
VKMPPSASLFDLDLFAPLPIHIEASDAPLRSDAGLLPLRQFDERIGLTKQFAAVLDDPRDPELAIAAALPALLAVLREKGGGQATELVLETLRRDRSKAGRCLLELVNLASKPDPNGAAIVALLDKLGSCPERHDANNPSALNQLDVMNGLVHLVNNTLSRENAELWRADRDEIARLNRELVLPTAAATAAGSAAHATPDGPNAAARPAPYPSAPETPMIQEAGSRAPIQEAGSRPQLVEAPTPPPGAAAALTPTPDAPAKPKQVSSTRALLNFGSRSRAQIAAQLHEL